MAELSVVSFSFPANQSFTTRSASGRSFVSIGFRLSPRSKPSAVILKKRISFVLPREFLVEQEDAGLHAGVRLEHAGRERDDGHERILDEEFSQFHVGVLRGGDDAVGHDDAAATVGREMLGDVIGEEHFGFLRGDAKLRVRADAAFRCHERRIGENEIGFLIPTRVIGERVVDVNRRIGEAVQEQIHLAQLHHQVGDVVAGEIGINFLALIVRELVAGDCRPRRCVFRENVLVTGNQKSAGAAGGIENAIARLRIETRHHEINDVSRSAELTVLGLDAHRLEQILKGVAELLAVRVSESVHLIEKKREDAAVAELQERVSENIAEERGQMLRFPDRFDSFREEIHPLISRNGLRQQRAPAIFLQRTGKE